MNDEFALEGLAAFKELEGKHFSELGEYKSSLEATTIRCIILRKENPQSIIREIFSRLNQGAVELSEQDIRHALYPGSFNDLLRRLASIEAIKNFAKGPKSKDRKDNLEAEELVLRYFAFSEELNDYDRLSKFLDKFMETKQNVSTKELEQLEASFQKSLENCIAVFGDDVFRDTSKKGTRQSIVYYDLLMNTMGKYSPEFVEGNKDKFRAAFLELCGSTAFQKTLSGGLQNRASILKRREIWEEILRKTLQ